MCPFTTLKASLNSLSVGTFLIYLPPYSPDLNPIEELFSSVKSYLKANEALLQITDDIESILLAAFTNISSDDCKAWVKDSGSQ